MKMEVLSSKEVLVSDPSVGKMNLARWTFEYFGLMHKRKRFTRDLAMLLVGETIQDLDMDKMLKIIPLAYLLNPEVVEEYRKQQEEQPDTGEFMTDEEYEAMLDKYEESGFKLDDMELLEGDE